MWTDHRRESPGPPATATAPPGRGLPRAARLVAVAYYAALLALLALIIPRLLGDFLPRSVAHHVGADSEGYLLALLLGGWIQAARPRLQRSRAQWPVTLAVAALSAVLGVYLYNADVLGTVKTLNEPLLALAVLVPYVQLRRPLPARRRPPRSPSSS